MCLCEAVSLVSVLFLWCPRKREEKSSTSSASKIIHIFLINLFQHYQHTGVQWYTKSVVHVRGDIPRSTRPTDPQRTSRKSSEVRFIGLDFMFWWLTRWYTAHGQQCDSTAKTYSPVSNPQSKLACWHAVTSKFEKYN